jgi:hypothetical protein
MGKWLMNLIAPPGSVYPDYLCAMGSNSAYDMVSTKLDEGTAIVNCWYAYLSFQGDAGNTVTAQCLAESALTLIFDRESLPKQSEDGFGTSAELLGMPLFKRFQNCKVRPVEVQTFARTKTTKNVMKLYIN